MNLKDRFEAERVKLQTRLDVLLKDGAECLVKDGDQIVTHFFVDGVEVLLAQPFFDRLTGKLVGLTWWCWLREVHFEAAMQRSHLLHAKTWEWLNDQNISIQTDDYSLLISALDPPEVDERGNVVWQEWQEFKRNNLWLEKAADEIRMGFIETAKRAIR
jgi:hypothetical protein